MAKENAQDKLINLQAQQLAAQVANWAATLDFQKERFRLLELPQFQQGMQLDVDKFAWQRAEDTWQRAYQESLITGTYQGKPTTQWLIDQAKLTGSYNGERTLEGKLTDAQIQDMHDKMKLANDEFLANTTGYFNGQKTFDRDKFEAAQALEGWKFIATLSGPQNAFKQARAIASSPGGMTGLMDAFAGQYMLPSSGAVGSGGQASLNDMRMGWGGDGQSSYGGVPQVYQPGGSFVPQPGGGGSAIAPIPAQAPVPVFAPTPPIGYDPNMIQDPNNPGSMTNWGMWSAEHPGVTARLDGGVTPYPYGVDAQGNPLTSYNLPQGYNYSPPGVQAPAAAWNYSPNADGSVASYPPGVASPVQTADVSSYQPVSPLAVAPVLQPAYQYGGAANAQGLSAPVSGQTTSGMLLPSQINGENYDNSYQYQRDLLWANYEDQGWDPSLAQESFLRSLPKYAGPSKGAIAF